MERQALLSDYITFITTGSRPFLLFLCQYTQSEGRHIRTTAQTPSHNLSHLWTRSNKHYFVETFRPSEDKNRLDTCSRLTLMQMPVLQDKHSVIYGQQLYGTLYPTARFHQFQIKKKNGPTLFQSCGSSTLCM